MTNARLFAAIGVAAAIAGAALWHFGGPARSPVPAAGPAPVAPAIAPAAVFAVTFADAAGAPRSLGQFQGQVVVVNFWATWCAPCRAEMPAFERVHRRWAARGVRVVGLSDDPPETAARFGRDLGIGYPLWTGADQVTDLSRRFGNSLGVLPHTVILGPKGEVLAQKVGPYTEDALERELAAIVAKSG